MLSEVYFYHIPKTAGTSLSAMIRTAYPQSQRMEASLLVDMLCLPIEQRSQYRCYTGHFYSLLEPLIGRKIPTVTLLRDPFEQTVSAIQFYRRHSRGDCFSISLYKTLLNGVLMSWSFLPRCWKDSLAERFFPIVTNNFQTRCLGGTIDLPDHLEHNARGIGYPILEKSFFNPEEEMPQILERAKEKLRGMVVVGTVERFQESLKLIFEHIGAPVPHEIRRDNANPYRSAPNPSDYRQSGVVSTEFEEFIDSQTRYDRELYRFANELLDQKISCESTLPLSASQAGLLAESPLGCESKL